MQVTDTHLKIELEDSFLEIIPRSPTCIQVRAGLPEVPLKPTHMVINNESFEDWLVEETKQEFIIATAKLRLCVEKNSGRLTWLDSSGKILLRESSEARILESLDVKRYRFDPSRHAQVVKTVDGERTVGLPIGEYIDRKAISYVQEFVLSSEEALYGLGQHEEGVFNLRGTWQHLFQANMKSPAPVILSTAGYGLFFETAAVSGFESKGDTMRFWSNCADSLSYYFILGPQFDEIIATLRSLTGKVPMLPRWAFGYIQSKERYNCGEELLEIGREFRKRNIPIDCLVQDWKYWPNDWWGEKSFDPDRFPDPADLLKQLHGIHLRLMISIWPNLRNDGPNQQALSSASYLLGDNSTYDAFQTTARERYWEQAHHGLFRYGLDAWWCDSTEPFNNEWGGAIKPSPEERLEFIDETFNHYLDPADANAYPLVHAMGIYEGQRNRSSDKRVLNLTRSSFPGQQRYGCIVWSGDISARWDVLRKQIAEGLNLCVTGMPYWTVDIGAFFTGGHACFKKWSKNDQADPVWFWAGDYDAGVADYGYRELYVRWLQWATFLPIMRSHGTDTPREPWQFGNQGDRMYDIIVDYIRLRYRLLPYLYSLAGWQTHKDYTMMRLLAFDFREDPQVYDVADQYMLGPCLMVCPVTTPMYYGPESKPLEGVAEVRKVYLPDSTGWYDFWTERYYSGGQNIEVNCPLERIPIFVKAGSILPLGEPVENTDVHQEVRLKIYSGADAEFSIYTDSGDGYAYESGDYTLNRICWDDLKQTVDWGDESPLPFEIITPCKSNDEAKSEMDIFGSTSSM